MKKTKTKTMEFGVTPYHLFVGFKSAYDAINREQLYLAMGELKIPCKLITMAKLTREDAKSHALREGDALSGLLSNITLENIVRDADIQTNGTILYKSVQLLAYEDDMDTIVRSQPLLKDAFPALEGAEGIMGLRMNKEKTKHMITSQIGEQSDNITVGNYTFEVVQTFIYIGSSVSCNNDISQEIEKGILITNK
jgi:sorting nexin-29